ncbi:MAG: MBL fold metallo-hydrolase [Anaerolineae bacterium]|jgi:glyoxylase-like metal-dependent hydrolase (beta-lactamase superfamily II)|nr:MBL fold metallo-hydrolase [Anaerolineae bacterium]
MKMVQIKLGFSNACLIIGDKPILVDTGVPGEEDKILRAVEAAGVQPGDISLILHTHGHADHVGSTAALRSRLGVPVAIHRADEAMLRGEGATNRLEPLRLESRLMLPFIHLLVNKPLTPIAPDLLIDEGTDLSAYGVDVRVLHTPGHTAGSLSFLLPKGDAIVGDLMMGGILGGYLGSARPNYPYYADDLEALRRSIRKVCNLSPNLLYVGHGGPLPGAPVGAYFSKIIRS